MDRFRPKPAIGHFILSGRFVPQVDTRPRVLDWVGKFQSCRGPVPWVELEVLAQSAGKTDPTVRAVARVWYDPSTKSELVFILSRAMLAARGAAGQSVMSAS